MQRRCNGVSDVSLTEIKPGLLTKTEPACRGVAQPDSRERHRLGLKIARTPTQGSLADSVAGLEDTVPLGLQNCAPVRAPKDLRYAPEFQCCFGKSV